MAAARSSSYGQRVPAPRAARGCLLPSPNHTLGATTAGAVTSSVSLAMMKCRWTDYSILQRDRPMRSRARTRPTGSPAPRFKPWSFNLPPVARPEYGSCIAVTFAGQPMIVTGTSRGIVAVDADNGHLLWSNEFSSGNTANCPTPAYAGGYVSWANGYGRGGTRQITREKTHDAAERVYISISPKDGKDPPGSPLFWDSPSPGSKGEDARVPYRPRSGEMGGCRNWGESPFFDSAEFRDGNLGWAGYKLRFQKRLRECARGKEGLLGRCWPHLNPPFPCSDLPTRVAPGA